MLQAADSLELVIQGIQAAKSTDSDKLIKAMQTMKFDSLRGVSDFSTKPGYSYQQWLEIPFVNYELTAEKQPIGQTVLIQAPGPEVRSDQDRPPREVRRDQPERRPASGIAVPVVPDVFLSADPEC